MKIIFYIVMIMVFVSPSVEAAKSGDVKEGNRLYEEGKFDESLDKYKEILEDDSETDIINFNAGTAFYKTQDYENAIVHFRKALLGKDEPLKANAYYNLGNSMYQFGMTKEEEDLQSAVTLLESALQEYEKSLQLNSEDKVVKSNHAYVSKELERLKEKLQQQQQDKTCPLPPKDSKQDQNQENQQESKKSSSQDEQQSDSSKQNQNDANNEKENQQNQSNQSEEQKDNQGQSEQEESLEENQEEESNDEKSSGGTVGSQANANNTEENTKVMSEEEYQMFLKEYQQTEEPKGILNMQPRSMRTRNIDKDW